MINRYVLDLTVFPLLPRIGIGLLHVASPVHELLVVFLLQLHFS